MQATCNDEHTKWVQEEKSGIVAETFVGHLHLFAACIMSYYLKSLVGSDVNKAVVHDTIAEIAMIAIVESWHEPLAYDVGQDDTAMCK